jgi:hypothetical protein
LHVSEVQKPTAVTLAFRRLNPTAKTQFLRGSHFHATQTIAPAFINRSFSTANLNIHIHVIARDDVYEEKSNGRLKFYAAQAASVAHSNAFGPNAGQPVRR